MINQLLKLGLFIATGRFLKPRVKGLLWVAAVWILLWFVHSEYVEYVQLSGDTSLVLKAALVKTGLYALSIALYVLLVERKLWPRPVAVPPPQKLSPQKTHTDAPATRQPRDGDDGFDFLRDKRKLRNPAKDLLERK
jgi:hypothetical protein